MLLSSGSFLVLLSQPAQVRTLPKLSWITRSGLDFGLALFKVCQGLVTAPTVLVFFPSRHARVWRVSLLRDYDALHSYWNQQVTVIILLGIKFTYFLQSLKQATRNEFGLRLHFLIQKLPLTNFKTKVELVTYPTILPPYRRLTFIADVSHTIAEANSIIFAMFFLQTQNFLNQKG